MNVDWPLLIIVGIAIIVITAVLVIGAQIGATHRRRTGGLPAPGDGHQAPAPGQRTTHPNEAAVPPSRPTPAPGFTPEETAILDAIRRQRITTPPRGAYAGRIIADGLRERFPHLDDATLGLVALDLHGYAVAIWAGLPPNAGGLALIVDAFGLAAEDLTHLARLEEVRFDQP